MRKLRILALIAALMLTNCASYASFVQSLNDREVKSCVCYEGHASRYVSVRGLTATGGTPLEACAELFVACVQ